MIKPEIAQKLIEKITSYTEYNINIMDEKGVIIASRDKSRIGMYHEAADRILKGREEIVEITDTATYPGVLPGINMTILVDGRREGVVGVTGDPAQIRDVALVIRLAIEAMLKYEKEQELALLRRGRKENFLYMLTHVENAAPSELRAAAKVLGYDESVLRVPILCRIGDQASADRVLELLRASQGHQAQDFSEVWDERHVVVFKSLQQTGGRAVSDFKGMIAAYLEDAIERLRREGIRADFFVGTMQGAFSQYFHAFRHCRWLEEQVLEAKAKAPSAGAMASGADAMAPGAGAMAPGARADGPAIWFFYDRAAQYFYSIIPREELQRVFHQFSRQLAGAEREQFLETAGGLIEANFNLTEAARRLYVHKNTMSYRYNKLKEQVGIDPIKNTQDREFLMLLYYSLLPR